MAIAMTDNDVVAIFKGRKVPGGGGRVRDIVIAGRNNTKARTHAKASMVGQHGLRAALLEAESESRARVEAGRALIVEALWITITLTFTGPRRMTLHLRSRAARGSGAMCCSAAALLRQFGYLAIR